jgi:hypothetical protein
MRSRIPDQPNQGYYNAMQPRLSAAVAVGDQRLATVETKIFIALLRSVHANHAN